MPFLFFKGDCISCFNDCQRLRPLFAMLSTLFFGSNEGFSLVILIFGFKYVQKYRFKCQLLNFLLGQAKLAIYVSRKRKVEQDVNVGILLVFSTLVRCRILIDFHFHKSMKILDVYEEKWCYNNVLCVKNDKLQFAHCFAQK